MRKEYIINEIKDLIESKGGKLISTDFSGKKPRGFVKCNKGHSWWTRIDSLKEGKWCLDCYLNKEGKYNKLKEFIETKGGKLLSESYKGVKIPVLIECKNGHQWWVRPDNILNGKTWCPKCKFEELSKKYTQYAIEDLKKIAKERGGDCIENNYLGWDVNHHWECASGHKWSATPRNVISGETWCPYCAEDELSERICRGFFETFFNDKFTKTAPNWLNLDLIGKPGGRRHLDGYNEKLNIAFEYHGIQHYKYEPFYHKGDFNNFLKQQEIDELKRTLTIKNAVILIEVGFVWEKNDWRKLKFDEMEQYIREQLKLKGITLQYNREKIDWIQFISIHLTQDLILKLLLQKTELCSSEIAGYLNENIKSVKEHLERLNSLGFLNLRLGKQNRKFWSINEAIKDQVIKKIPETILDDRRKLIMNQIEKDIIRLLDKKKGLSTESIAKELGYSKRTIENYIKSLEIRDFINYRRATGLGQSHPKIWYIKDPKLLDNL